MREPLTVDGDDLVYETFVQESTGDQIISIDDRTYRIRRADRDVYYTMLRVGGHQRTVRGDLNAVLQAVGRIHCVYRDYENRVRRLKQEAQRVRDRALNQAVESA